MAQIIKYEQGGSTSKKYGTFTIDGHKYDVNDEFLNQLTNYGKSLDSNTAYQFSKITEALKSGTDLSYDSNANRLDGNVQFDVTNTQNNRLGKRRSRIGRWFGNSWNGKENASRNAINALKNFKYIEPTPSGTDYDWSGKINVEYKRDKDGKYELVDGKRVFIQGANNLQALRRLDALSDIINYGDNDTFKGYNGLQKQAYIDLYNRLGPEGVKALRKRIETGDWDEADKLALDDIGILLGDEPTAEEIAQRKVAETDPQVQAEEKEKERYRKAGWDYNLRNIFGVDDNGNVTIVDPTLQSYIGTGDAWLNDEFRKVYRAYADYIPEKTGLFVINGKVYRGDNQAALSKIQKYLDFVKDNRRTAGNASNIKQYWRENDFSGWSDLGYDSNGNPIYSPVFKPGEFGRDVSGYFMRTANDPFIFEYYKDYDANNDALFDQFGHPLRDKATRVFIDPITKKQVDTNDSRYHNYISSLKEQTNQRVIDNYYNNVTNSAFSPYYNLGSIGNIIRVVGTGSDNNPFTGYSLFQKPGSDLYYWYDENPGGNNYTINGVMPSGSDKMRDYIWNIDPELGKLLSENPDMLRDTRVKNLISDYIRNPYTATVGFRRTTRQEYADLQQKYPHLINILRRLDEQGPVLGYGNYRKNYSYKGGSNHELRNINSPEALESRGLAYRIGNFNQIPYQKNGGVLKFQIGGTAASRAKSIRASHDNIQNADTKLRKAGEDKVIGDGTELNASDKAEIAALIADAASLGATFVPVYGNALSAGVGAAGSVTGFGADIARDGLDWGDVGNLALNLGLDAATLLPGIGTGAKATKVAKALKKSKALAKAIKYASMTLSGSSAIAGLTTAWNNIQDGSWTIKDIRTVLNGVRGIANISRTKGNAKTKASTSDIVTLKPQDKSLPTIKLNKLELESIQNAPQNSRADKLEELIISRLPKDVKTDQITDILSSYGIKRKEAIGWNWKNPLTFNKNATVNTNQFKYDKIPGTYRNPSELSWWNWNKRAAIRDAKINKENPYFRPLHWETNKVSDLNSIQPITMPIYSNFAPDLGVFSNTPQERYYYHDNDKPTFYKKGGNILKATKGSVILDPLTARQKAQEQDRIENITNAYYNQGNGNNLTQIPQDNNFLSIFNSLPNNMQKIIGLSNNKKLQSVDLVQKHNDNLVAKNRSQKLETPSITKPTQSYFGQEQPKRNNQSYNYDAIYGIGDAIVSAIGIDKTNQKMKDAVHKGMIGSQQQMPHEFYLRFSDNGLHRMYDNRIQNMQQYKTVTSDPNAVLAERLMRDVNVDQLKNERDTKFSQMIDQYNDRTLAQKQQYANLRTQISNQNKNKWYQGLAQKDMIDANRVRQQTQTAKNLIYQFRQNYARDLQEMQQASLASKQLQADNAYKADLMSRYSSEYTPEMQKLYTSLEDYVFAKHPKEMQELRNQHYANFAINQYNEGIAHSWWGRPKIPLYQTPYQYTPHLNTRISQIFKKGGTVQRFRNVDEQHYLDQQKAINKAINDLNNNIIKLFIKMMS